MKKILWVSRHEIHDRQMRELKRLYGNDVKVILNRRDVSNVQEILKTFNTLGCFALVIVAPLSVMEVMLREQPGIIMLWSVSEEENDPSKVEFRGARGQGFRFVKFQRIVKIEKILENIEPE